MTAATLFLPSTRMAISSSTATSMVVCSCSSPSHPQTSAVTSPSSLSFSSSLYTPCTDTTSLLPLRSQRLQRCLLPIQTHGTSPAASRSAGGRKTETVCRASRKGGGKSSKEATAGRRVSSPAAVRPEEMPPSSREDAIRQAQVALKSVVDRRPSKKGGKPPRPTKQQRLALEIPMADSSPTATAQLCLELISALSFLQPALAPPQNLVALVTCGTGAAAQAALAATQDALSLSSLGSAVMAARLDGGVDQGESRMDALIADSEIVMLLAPTNDDVQGVNDFLRRVGPRNIVIVNALFDDNFEASAKLAESLEYIYCFMPLAVQGMFSSFDGSIMRVVTPLGPPTAAPWRVFVTTKSGEGSAVTEENRCLVQQRSRPTPTELENVLYNWMGMQSPLTRTAAFIKGLTAGGGFGKK